MKIWVERKDTGGRISIAFEARCDDALCGQLTAHRLLRKVGGKTVYAVDNVFVSEPARRSGVATKLYEAAANEACKRRSRLASVERNPGAHSTDFWKKQVAKGRARAVPIRGADPDRYTQYLLVECPRQGADLSELRRRR